MEPFDTQCDHFQEFQNDYLYHSTDNTESETEESFDYLQQPPQQRPPLPRADPPFPPPNFQYNFTTFRTIEAARALASNISDPSGCFICLPLHFITSIRTQKRKFPLTGYIIHHDQ